MSSTRTRREFHPDDVDSGIRDLCVLLNRHGVQTVYSCSGLWLDHPATTEPGKTGGDQLYIWSSSGDRVWTAAPYILFLAPPKSQAFNLGVKLAERSLVDMEVGFHTRKPYGPRARVGFRIFVAREDDETDIELLERLDSQVNLRWRGLEQAVGEILGEGT